MNPEKAQTSVCLPDVPNAGLGNVAALDKPNRNTYSASLIPKEYVP
jgi:hypothetical protein